MDWSISLYTDCVHVCYSFLFFFFLQIEVTLIKDPTLGLGITGGIDGENSIKPGDTVS